jgi:hypothetical protein
MSQGQGSISYLTPPTFASIINKPATIQFMFVVGGPNNFASIPGAPAVPVAGDSSMTTNLLVGFNVRMSRNGLWQEGFNPLDGNTFYTKVTAANIINWSGPLGAGEEIIIETIPL